MKLLLFAVVLYVLQDIGHGLYCLECRDAVSPLHCHTVKRCYPGEVCYAVRRRTVNNLDTYDLGCDTPYVCNSSSPTANCTECCTTDACNIGGCYDPGNHHGLLCFNCQQTTNPSLCDHFTQCVQDHVCILKTVTEYNDVFYSSGCVNKHACSYEPPAVIGRRSTEHCPKCCSTDLCNNDCERTEKITTGTTTTSTTTARTTAPDPLFVDCLEIFRHHHTTSKVYTIYPWGSLDRPVDVYCDMATQGGGWTVIQKRFDGSLSFDRNWTEYKNGFGLASSEYWLGNDAIFELTRQNTSSLYVSIKLVSGTSQYEKYGTFSISEESDGYRLYIKGPAHGTLGDTIVDPAYSSSPENVNGMVFCTKGHACAHDSCAIGYQAGWWFNNCHNVFLNGNFSDPWPNAWSPTITNRNQMLAGTIMMIKRH